MLRARFPGLSPDQVSKAAYQTLYGEMATDTVAGWDKAHTALRLAVRCTLMRRRLPHGRFCPPKAWRQRRRRGLGLARGSFSRHQRCELLRLEAFDRKAAW